MFLRFFKLDNNWYADVPNHTLEENQMVMGSDILLDFISNGKSKITIEFELKQPQQYILHLQRRSADNEGAYYTLVGSLYNQFLNSEYNPIHEIWICNVTLDVFGCFPENIFVVEIT